MFSNYNNNFTIPTAVKSPLNTATIPWLSLINVTNQFELSSQYAQVCQQHRKAKKWVLIINPDELSLEQLANYHGIDISKILCVNLKNKLAVTQSNREILLDIEQIKAVLKKGNCSAVILSNATFDSQEIAQLNHCAQQGETQCVLLKNHAPSNHSVH